MIPKYTSAKIVKLENVTLRKVRFYDFEVHKELAPIQPSDVSVT